MSLYEYLIKLLMGNSNSLFIGLIVVIFGYFGWLLKNIYEQINSIGDITSIIEKENKNRESLEIIRKKVEELNDGNYKDILDRLDDNLSCLEKIYSKLENSNLDVDRLQNDIISEIKEESDEIKEIIKILMSRTRIRRDNSQIEE